MRHYERESFRRLNDSERYRDYDYLADDAWVGPNEEVPHGMTRADEPPWSTLGPWETRPFAAERAWDEDRGQGRQYGRDLGLGYGLDHDVRAREARTRDDDYRRGHAASASLVSRSHAGVGPRNWRRSDARILEEVCELLAAHPDLDASDIEVSVSDGEVTLAGVVEDRRTKYLAEDILDDVLGVEDLHNRLRVRATAEPGASRILTSSRGAHAGTSTAAVRR